MLGLEMIHNSSEEYGLCLKSPVPSPAAEAENTMYRLQIQHQSKFRRHEAQVIKLGLSRKVLFVAWSL